MKGGSRILQNDDGWWFWQESFQGGPGYGYSIAGSWVGPFDDRDEAEGAMRSNS